MEAQRIERRLAAILAADMVGFSRLMEAADCYRDSLARNPDHIGPRIGLAACYAEMGRDEDARAQGAEVLRINPKFTLAKYAESLTCRAPAQSEKTLQALRSAGLPG